MAKGRQPRHSEASVRAQILERLGTAASTDSWARSSNPVKKRVGRLEVVWREAIQWLLEDIQRMFQNFAVIADAYDEVDINAAALKSLLVEKGVITEEEFASRRGILKDMLIQERTRRQEEMERLKAEEKERRDREDAESDPNADLRRMKKAAESAASNPIPNEAFIFGQ